MALQIDPAVCLLAGDVELHKFHVVAIGIQIAAVNYQLLSRIFMYFKFGEELLSFDVPEADLAVDACSH